MRDTRRSSRNLPSRCRPTDRTILQTIQQMQAGERTVSALQVSHALQAEYTFITHRLLRMEQARHLVATASNGVITYHTRRTRHQEYRR